MTERHVYVLDDDPEITTVIRRTCMTLGIPASTFNSIDAFLQLSDFPPGSVILLDLNLGAGNGIDILRLLAGRRCRAAILLMSGVDERLLNTVQKLGQSYGLNIQGVLPKPFRVAEFKAKLDAAAASASAVATRRTSPQEALHRAIMGGELRLHYQPKLDIRTGALVGCEALVRWEHPERGMVPPAEFLPLAEETGLMRPLTHWVLDEAIRQAAVWCRDGICLSVSVNMPADMLNELSLPTAIEQLLRTHGLDGASLTLEVTESAVMRDLLTTTDVLARLRLMGVSLSIDDFGTGHSSMIKLRQLPFNEIKLDRSFVQDMGSDADAKALVSTMIGMGRGFGMRIVAEGVETAEALAALAALGCEMAQGYHISRPLAAEAFAAWAMAHRADPETGRARA